MSQAVGDDAESIDAESDGPFADFIATIADQIRSDEPIDLDAETARHPEWAERLRRLVPAMRAMSHARTDRESAATADRLFAGAVASLSDFRIVREIGRGGMGVVYEAIQVSLDRRVALKVLPAIQAGDPRRRRRFQVEAKAAASLTHPHIVPVHAVGEEAGVPYFAMQLVDRRDIEHVLSGARADGTAVREIASLGRQAAEALQHAHERGVIHRDVKPSNLLVDGSGWLWVADFGLALCPGQVEATATGSLLGTLRYMSPEQLIGDRGLVDHRVDLYGLGASLYEWLTRRPAFPGDDRIDLLQRIAHDEPTPPRRIDPAIPKDLETIVLKAIAKDPAARYDTAEELAADFTRFLEGRAISARPPGPARRAARWTRRHRPEVAVAWGFVLVGLIGLVAAWSWRDRVRRTHSQELASATALAAKETLQTRRLRYGSEIRRAQQALADRQPEFAQDILQRLKPAPGGDDDRGFEWSYLWRACRLEVADLARHEADVAHLALSPDGKTLVSRDDTGTLVFWDLSERAERARIGCPARSPGAVTFSPDGEILATWDHSPGDVRLWDPATAKEVARIPGIRGEILDVFFAPDGRTLAVREKVVRAGSSLDRTVFWDLGRDPSHPKPGLPPFEGWALCYSPDGRWLATATPAGPIRLTDRTNAQGVKTLAERFPAIGNLTFSGDGKTLAAAHGRGVTVWDVDSTAELSSIEMPSPPDFLAFLPDGDRLVGRIWGHPDVVFIDGPRSRSPRVRLQGIPAESIRVAMSPDGKILASAGKGQPATLWDTSTGNKLATFPRPTGDILGLAFAPDGRSLFLAGSDAQVQAWNFGKGPEPTIRVEAHAAEVWALAFSPDGRTLISAADDHSIKLWDPRDGRPLGQWDGHDALVASLAVNPAGTMLASASFDKTVRLRELPSGRPGAVLRGHAGAVRAVAISPDGRLVATGGNDATIRLWDAASGESRAILGGHSGKVRALAFDPLGRFLAAAGNDPIIRVVGVASSRETAALPCPARTSSVSFSPDGTLLASSDDVGNIIIWDVANWSRKSLHRISNIPIWGLAFSPDGRTLAAACGDARVRLLDPIAGQVLLDLDGHSRRVNAVAFAPDGRALASAGHDGSIRLWRLDTP